MLTDTAPLVQTPVSSWQFTTAQNPSLPVTFCQPLTHCGSAVHTWMTASGSSALACSTGAPTVFAMSVGCRLDRPSHGVVVKPT